MSAATLRRGLGPGLALAALAVIPLLLGEFRLGLVTEIIIFGILAASLDLLMGYAGLPSLGHAAFFGIGGYGAALVATRLTENGLVAVAVATVAAGAAAVVIGALAVRARGIYFLMLTLAIAQLLYTLALTWEPVTGGSNGITRIPAAKLLPTEEDAFLISDVAFYYYVLAAAVIAYVCLSLVAGSPFGRVLSGIRENEERMRSLGYQVHFYKLAAFTLAGAVGGYAGALFVQHSRFISPTSISFVVSILVVVMVIVGGTRTLYGGLLGAAVVLYLRDELSTTFERWELVLGFVFVAFVYFLPRGVAGGLRDLAGRLPRRGPGPPAATREGVSP
jgi:branched-chain amino acid transport system permease protein